MKTTARIIFGASLLVNILLILVLWKRPRILDFGVEEKMYRDSISTLRNESLKLGYLADSLGRENDSLKLLKQKEIIRYNAKVKFIYTADPRQLDSVIRKISGF